MPDEKLLDTQSSPQVKVETPEVTPAPNTKGPDASDADEYEERVVIDHIEKQYGDPAKAEKKIKVKKEKPIDPITSPVTDPEKKDDEPAAKVDDTKPADKAKPLSKEKKIEVDNYFDPMDAPLPKVDEKALTESAAKAKVEEKTPSKSPEQIADEQNLSEYKKQAEVYKKLTSTPQGKFLVELAEKGEDVLAAVTELGLTRDYKTAPEQMVLTDYLKNIDGLEGEALQTAIDEHNDLTPAMQRKFIRDARVELDYKQQQKIGQYRTNINNNKQQGEEVFRRFESALENEIDESYVKRDAYSIKLTPDEVAELRNDSKNIFKRLFNADGTINEKVAVFYTFAEKHMRSRMRKNDYLKGRTEGMEKVLETVHQPDRMESTMSAPVKVEKVTDVDRINRQYGNGLNPNKT